MQTQSKHIDVAVCIPTFRRPDRLEKLLESIVRAAPGSLSIGVVIVDNDPNGSARSTVEKFGSSVPLAHYEVEPLQGYARVRNRLVAIAVDLGARWVSFLDDDQEIDPGWVRELTSFLVLHEPDAVAGPVRPKFEVTPAEWIRRVGFFDRQEFANCSIVQTNNTGNLTVAGHWLKRPDGPFDKRFDLIGAEDTKLLMELREMGLQQLWASDVVAYEWYPRERTRLKWLMGRSFKGGVSFSMVLGTLNPTVAARFRRTGRCFGRASSGIALALPRALVHGRTGLLRSCRDMLMGIGGIFGVVMCTLSDLRNRSSQ